MRTLFGYVFISYPYNGGIPALLYMGPQAVQRASSEGNFSGILFRPASSLRQALPGKIAPPTFLLHRFTIVEFWEIILKSRLYCQ